jgi:hypothetical protein|tara:strand:+ start:62 stop:274 length:213 start_codon:yes stop_codon:yes gene_type:complete
LCISITIITVLIGIILDGITLGGTIGVLIIGAIEIDGDGTMEWATIMVGVGTTDLIIGAIILIGILTIIT